MKHRTKPCKSKHTHAHAHTQMLQPKKIVWFLWKVDAS
jgi:hypothetical protein